MFYANSLATNWLTFSFLGIKSQFMDKLRETLSVAVRRLLRPLVRILLRNGIPFGTFSELAKQVYVDVAYDDFAERGRKQTASRVSALTGLTRKEVKRLRELPGEEALAAADQRYNRAIRVISGWTNDETFQDEDGSWFVTGQKIFITSGHAKWHYVIARTEDSTGDADGLKGLSMFLVKAFDVDDDGNIVRTHTSLDNVEDKLGHTASATVSISYDRSPAMLIGERGQGQGQYHNDH